MQIHVHLITGNIILMKTLMRIEERICIRTTPLCLMFLSHNLKDHHLQVEKLTMHNLYYNTLACLALHFTRVGPLSLQLLNFSVLWPCSRGAA